MFRTVTVHPQELLCRYCMCRLWYVVRDALSDTSGWYNSLGRISLNYIYIAKMVHGPSNAKLRKYVFAKSNLVVLEVLHLLNANTSSSGTAIAGRLSKFSVGISLSLILRESFKRVTSLPSQFNIK